MRKSKSKIKLSWEVKDTEEVMKAVNKYIGQEYIESCVLYFRSQGKGLTLRVFVEDSTELYKIVDIHINSEWNTVYISSEDLVRDKIKDKFSSKVLFSQEFYAHDTWANNTNTCHNIEAASKLNIKLAAKKVVELVKDAKSSNAIRFIKGV